MNKDNYVTILAIYDDPPPQPVISSSSSGSSPTIITVDKTSQKRHNQNISDGVVEITNLNDPPSYGLKVVPEVPPPNYSGKNSPFLSHHRSEHSSSTTASFRRSPTSESFQKPFHSNSSGSSRRNNKEIDMNSAAAAEGNLSRSQARKSRFTDAFLDARDRLEESNENNETFLNNITDPNLRQMKVILSAESINIPLGIEISAVPDLNDNRRTRILAVEVRKIDDDGRVAFDGRIKVGDQITDINHRPVYQMSLPAAQARLHELQYVEEPLLVVTRRTGDEINDSGAPKALKTTALQQANTTKTGEVLTVLIKKSSAGFGFGVKSRVNTRAETLICVNSVSINGPAYNKLQIGDRLLKINETEVTTFSQAEIVEMLKKAAVGSTITFCISRITAENEQTESDNIPQQSTSQSHKAIPESLEMVHKRRQSAFVDILDENVEFLTFDVQLINSRSAGLGISLKGGKLYPESGTLESGVDCGLFVKGILHGSAAFHDGRFRENDRLIGIEKLDLREYKHNADALAAFTNTLGNVPLQQKSVKIHIARCKDYPAIDFGRKSSMKNKDILPYKATSAYVDGYESEVSLAPDSEAFNRENRTRKSISEKKHPFGSGKDAIHAQAYQKILHQRQTSAPQFPLSEVPNISNEFKKRRASLTHRLPLSIAPQFIDLELSPNENKAPAENDYWTALNKLQKSMQRQSMFIESTTSTTSSKPFQAQSLKSMKGQSASKLAPLSQLFQHLKGSKKDKSRRHTIYVAPQNDVIIEPLKIPENLENKDDDGLKPRSLSHEPLSSKDNLKSKEETMIHEVIAGTKAATLQPGNVLRRKKIEPAPSFKMAMSNSQPAFGVSEGEQVHHEFQPEMLRDKNKRKSTGGFFRFLQRGGENSPQKHGSNDDYEIAPRLPPPYNAPHRPIPPAVPPHASQAYRYPRTIPGPPISHHRIHSAQESTSNYDVFLVSNSSTLPTKRINYQDPTNIGVCLNQKPYTITKSIAMMDQAKQPTTSRPRLTSYNTPTTWPVEPQMPTTSSIRPRLTSVPHPINNNNLTFINDNSFNNNNVKGRNKISSPRLADEMGNTLWDHQQDKYKIPQTTTATIMMPSIPGSHKQPVHLEENTLPHRGDTTLPLWLATSTVTKHRRIPSPPPLMPRNCSAPAIPHRTHRNSQPITSVPLHRVPSPSSPLHILTPTTPPMQQVHTDFERPSSHHQQESGNRRMSLRFRKQRSEPPPEPLSKTPPAENKKFFFSWARASKTSFQNPDPRTRRSVRALKTPSATFYYDKDEAPVKC